MKTIIENDPHMNKHMFDIIFYYQIKYIRNTFHTEFIIIQYKIENLCNIKSQMLLLYFAGPIKYKAPVHAVKGCK